MPPDADNEQKIIVRPETTVTQRLTIYGYIGFLYLVMPFTGVWGTTSRFLLKDRFHQSADAIAGLLFLVTIPAYFGFLFGFVRDRWSPFGRRDQGFLILFSSFSAVLLIAMAILPITYTGLVVLLVANVTIGQFLSSAQQGLTSVLGQERLMTGRISSVWQAAATVPGLVLAIVAGYLYDNLAPHNTFMLAATIAVAVALFTLWRPKYVFDDPAETQPIVHKNIRQDIGRLFRAPGIVPIVILLLLWNFTPGTGTPIQFYLTDTLHGKATQYGQFNAIFSGFFIPTFLLYGYLCNALQLSPALVELHVHSRPADPSAAHRA